MDLLTRNTGKKLPCKILYLTVWKGYKHVAFQKIEYTLPEQVCDNTDMTSIIETVSEMYALVAVLSVVGLES